MPVIKLQCSDGEIIENDEQIAKFSATIQKMLKNCAEGKEIIELPMVKTTILKKVLDWVKYHKDDETKEKGLDDITLWDKEFMKVDQQTLFDLTLAAKNLDIKGLVKLTCDHVADLIKDKTSKEIRKIFLITEGELLH